MLLYSFKFVNAVHTNGKKLWVSCGNSYEAHYINCTCLTCLPSDSGNLELFEHFQACAHEETRCLSHDQVRNTSIDISLCICVSTGLSISLSFDLFVHTLVHLSVCLSMCLSACLSVSLSMCLSASMPVCQSVCMYVCICMSVCLPVSMSVYVSVCQYIVFLLKIFD